MTDRDHVHPCDSLRAAVEEVADQLCFSVDGNFDFRVDVDVSDPSVEKLQMLINFVLDSARRSIEEHAIVNEELQMAMRKLEASCKKAEEANQAKSDFLANMSHELRTPLTAILGFAGLIRSECDKSIHTSLDIILRNGEHLLQIINDILDLAKIEVGRVEASRSIVHPTHLIDETLQPILTQALAKQIEVRCTYKTPIPKTIRIDPFRYRQILTNLLSNAVKFTERGRIDIEFSYRPAPDDVLVADVIDTGIGIAEANIEKLFQPFSQIDSSMSRAFGGTGLGLVISRRFAEMLGGSVSVVKSHPGKGSHFRCEIAADTPADAEIADAGHHAPTPRATSSIRSSGHASIEGLQILLVEDGIDNRRLIMRILNKMGASVQAAENGQEALEMIVGARVEHHPFDAILMDMQMPVMDGYTATAKLREMHIDTPIIALTAHAMSGDREKCLAAGCDDYATKPVKPSELIDKIAKWVELSHCNA